MQFETAKIGGGAGSLTEKIVTGKKTYKAALSSRKVQELHLKIFKGYLKVTLTFL